MTACCLLNVINLLGERRHLAIYLLFVCLLWHLTNSLAADVCLLVHHLFSKCVERSFCKFNNLINTYNVCILPSSGISLEVSVHRRMNVLVLSFVGRSPWTTWMNRRMKWKNIYILCSIKRSVLQTQIKQTQRVRAVCRPLQWLTTINQIVNFCVVHIWHFWQSN